MTRIFRGLAGRGLGGKMSDIGFEIEALKAGKKVRRAGWKFASLRLTQSGYVAEYRNEKFSCEFCALSEDLLASDWEVVE